MPPRKTSRVISCYADSASCGSLARVAVMLSTARPQTSPSNATEVTMCRTRECLERRAAAPASWSPGQAQVPLLSRLVRYTAAVTVQAMHSSRPSRMNTAPSNHTSETSETTAETAAT